MELQKVQLKFGIASEDDVHLIHDTTTSSFPHNSVLPKSSISAENVNLAPNLSTYPANKDADAFDSYIPMPSIEHEHFKQELATTNTSERSLHEKPVLQGAAFTTANDQLEQPGSSDVEKLFTSHENVQYKPDQVTSTLPEGNGNPIPCEKESLAKENVIPAPKPSTSKMSDCEQKYKKLTGETTYSTNRRGPSNKSAELSREAELKLFTIQDQLLESIKKGEYKMLIAPSDLVDFGGQRSFDMTHQLFIQSKGSFVLMVDGRYNFDIKLKEYPHGNITSACK